MKTKFLHLALVLGVGFFAICAGAADAGTSATKFVEEFKSSNVFWQQFEGGKKIVALGDKSVLSGLTGWLTNENRHVRGNTAFVFAAMGDERGFAVLREILTDRSARPKGDGVNGNWTLQAQIASDRYYAVHLFGDLKDSRAVPILIPLIQDKEVRNIVPWSLGEIGDERAVEPLMGELNDKDPSLCVLAIYALEKLRASEALPRLRELSNSNERSNFGERMSVGDVANAAITKLAAGRTLNREGAEWVANCLKDFSTIKSAMTRRQVESRFPKDGGIQSVSPVRFCHPTCPYFKIDVEFDFKRNAADQNRAIEGKDDPVTRVSKPYIEAPYMD